MVCACRFPAKFEDVSHANQPGKHFAMKLKIILGVLGILLVSAAMVAAQTVQTLVSFNSANGATPFAGLTLGNDGNFYGATQIGGNLNLNGGEGYGTVFKMTTNGTLTTLISFNYDNGAYPDASLTLGNDGNFYGTTETGGSGSYGGWGTVFKVTTNGVLTTLVAFNNTNGASPMAALTLGNDGSFYGTTWQGGAYYNNGVGGSGTVFKVTTNGALTTLVSFDSSSGGAGGINGALTLGNDGTFYGTISLGGIRNSAYPNVWGRSSK
jgi:uncharacterized repeat protein (TIGR03803 family)